MSQTPPPVEDWDEYAKFGHTLRIPTDSTPPERSSNTVLYTADGAEVSTGVFVQFDRLPECAYHLQAFRDTTTPDICTVDLHIADDTASETPFTTDLMMPWAKFADLIDSDQAAVWDVNPADE